MIKLTKRHVIFYALAFLAYALYLQALIAPLDGRAELIFQYLYELFVNFSKSPIASLILSFGWFWLLIFQLQKLKNL